MAADPELKGKTEGGQESGTLLVPPGMSRKLLLVLGAAFLAAAGCTVFFYWLVSRHLSGPDVTPSQKTIAVAARDLPRGTRLEAADLTQAPWTAEEIPPGAAADAQNLLGRHLNENVYQGEPVVEARLAKKGVSGWSGRIPMGMRAVSVHVQEFAGVTNLIESGDRVDVLVADGPLSAGNPKVRMKTILQNVEVLTTGREQLPGSERVIPVATLLVDAVDSEDLNLADHSGTVRLTLRNPLDDATQDTRGGDLRDLLSSKRPQSQRSRRNSADPVDGDSRRASRTASDEGKQVATLVAP